MEQVYRYEILKPESIAQVMDAWAASPEGKKLLSGYPYMSNGVVKDYAFRWLFERVDKPEDPKAVSLMERQVIALEKIATAFVGTPSMPERGQPPMENA